MPLRLVACALAVLTVTCAGAQEPFVWDFAKDTGGWRPRSATMATERVTGADAGGKPQALWIRGVQADGWNYATCEPRPMVAGQLYRLSAWVRVAKLGPGTPAPYLKCEFVPQDRTKQLGRISSETYDLARPGEWQLLTGEFQAPPDTVAFWLALEKGGSQPCEIDALLGEVKVETIARLSAADKYRLQPLPPALEAAKGVHPRLYVNAARVAALREALKTTHAPLWEALRQQADASVKNGPPAYIERDRYSGDEQLWQREVGNAMPGLALAWLLTSDPKYLDAARAWALASCGYKTWGLGSTDGMDLAAGHQLFGLALVYDWCYADLGDEARRTIRETLVRRGTAMFEGAVSGKAWWTKSYLQNHLWVSACGLATAGLAVYDEAPDAELWVGLTRDKWPTTMASLGPDGASHEGVGYWQYGAEYLLKFMTLARDLLGDDMLDHPWWRHTAAYAQYFALPRQAWTRANCIVDLADCPRGNWYGPDHILRLLAAQYRDGHAQWLADEVASSKVDAPSARWLNILWYDPTVTAQPPTDLPTLREFADMGLVAARSDWSGAESLVILKCGAFIGDEAVQRFSYDPGGGHVHPDANHFLVFAQGEWLIRDDGYRAKWTGQHNTLLVDGQGQLGEGQMWLNGSQPLAAKSRPRVLVAESTPRLDHFAGEATPAYATASGLKRYVRHLLFLKPDVVLVLDDIVADAPRDLELRFHPEATAGTQEGNTVLLPGKLANLRLQGLTPESVTTTLGDVAAAGRDGAAGPPMYTVALKTHRAAWRNAVALSWSAKDAQPVPVTMETAGNVWTFHAGERTVRFDWGTGKAQ